jgi:hypothetical protein
MVKVPERLYAPGGPSRDTAGVSAICAILEGAATAGLPRRGTNWQSTFEESIRDTIASSTWT